MTALENIKNEFITNLLINQNKGVENVQKNLYSYEDYENLLQSAYEVIKNNPDDDITSIRKKMYETSGINDAVNHLIYEMEMRLPYQFLMELKIIKKLLMLEK